MLRVQLILALVILALALSAVGVALAQLFVGLGMPLVLAVVAGTGLVLLRLLVPFRPSPARSTDLLPGLLGLLDVVALAACFGAPNLTATALVMPAPAQVVALLFAVVAALVTELAAAACIETLAPHVRNLIAADLAVEAWFAQRRIDVERELLGALAERRAADVQLERRFRSLARRLERIAPPLPAAVQEPLDSPSPPQQPEIKR